MHGYPAALNNSFTARRPVPAARLREQPGGWLNQHEQEGAGEHDRAAGGSSHLAGESRHQGSADGQLDGHCSCPLGHKAALLSQIFDMLGEGEMSQLHIYARCIIVKYACNTIPSEAIIAAARLLWQDFLS